MAYEQYFSGYKRRIYNDGSYEDISTNDQNYGVVLHRAPARSLENEESDARGRSDAHNLQNEILAKILTEANAFEALSNMLIDAAGYGGPVSKREAKDLRNSIQDIKREIKKYSNPE